MAKKRPNSPTQVTDPAADGTEQGLLGAVLAEPDDDTPRLIYADWLEENGQPERAEFILLQIERARRPWPDGGTPGDRETALLATHGEKWLRPLLALRAPFGRERFAFHRGFAERVHHLELHHFIDWDDRIWRATPVSYIQLTDTASETGEYRPPEEIEGLLRAVAAKPELARLEGLGLAEHCITVGRLEILLASPHLAGLRSLDIIGVGYDWAPDGSGGRTPDHGRRVMTAICGLPALTWLDLSGSGIDAEDLDVLLASPLAGRLTYLGLGTKRSATRGRNGWPPRRRWATSGA
jgi:uncharacterized protein (TIGR02996 family)